MDETQDSAESPEGCFLKDSPITLADIPCSGELIAMDELAKKPVNAAVASSTAIGAVNEADVVMSRGAAEFDSAKRDLSSMSVCQGHYQFVMTNKPFDARVTVREESRAGSFGKKTSQTRSFRPCAVRQKLDEVEHDDGPVEADAGYLAKEDSVAVLKYCKNGNRTSSGSGAGTG